MWEIPAIIGFVMSAAFFSGSETGLYCVNRLRLRILAERGDPSARLLLRAAMHPRPIISTILVGTNTALYMATMLVTGLLLEAGLGDTSQFIAGLAMPPFLLVFADMLPKTLMQRHADRVMRVNIWPLRFFQFVFWPLAALLRSVSTLPNLIFRKKRSRRPPAVTPESFRLYLREGADQGVLSGFQRSMAMNILRLRSVPVSQAMTPVSRAVMISDDADGAALMALLGAHRYSRIPVYGGERPNVVGVLNVLDVVLGEGDVPAVRDLMREPVRVAADVSVAQALTMLRQQKQPFAVVQDRDGSTVGLLTIKDLVEEIVGELRAW